MNVARTYHDTTAVSE